MKYLFAFYILFCYPNKLAAQKPPIGPEVYNKWPSIEQVKISNNGSFVAYSTFSGRLSTLTIQATDNSWKKEILNASNATITEDSRRVIFIKKADSLCILTVTGPDSGYAYIPNVSSFKTIKSLGKEWLTYYLKQPENHLAFRDLQTQEERNYDSVINYSFSDNYNTLLLQTTNKKDSTGINNLLLVNPLNGATTKIWQGAQTGNFTFDSSGNKFAFIETQKRSGAPSYAIWYYENNNGVIKVFENRTIGIPDSLTLSNSFLRLSVGGDRIFFELKEIRNREKMASKDNVSSVDIWSYKDDRLQSQQLNEPDPYTEKAVINIKDKQVIRLTGKNEGIASYLTTLPNSDYVLIRKCTGDFFERSWRASARPSFYLVSTTDGTRKAVKEYNLNFSVYTSPGDNYIVYYDNEQKNYLSYNIKTGQTRNITAGIPFPLYDDNAFGLYNPFWGIGGWLNDGTAVFIYDQYDIWRVDLDGAKTPVNITAGYGRKTGTILRYCAVEKIIMRQDERQLLCAFNLKTKSNGFYYNTTHPEQLIMGPYVYYFNPYFRPATTTSSLSFSAPIIKARDSETYLVQRMSATEYPNLFSTKDLKHFIPLTDLQPQRIYNWHTTELIHWKALNGKPAEGILYKPEDFDSTKKYPLIFYFYEQNSNSLHFFNKPAWAAGQMNIPTYVSNGYLVCVPDITYTLGQPGKSTYDYVVSAAKYLSQMPWVDAKKMGMQGHSFGGYEVNYLVTHSHIFAAAVSAAGLSDLASGYGSLSDRGTSHSGLYEYGQIRMGSLPCKNIDAYIKNSPIFSADQVGTPLLIMHNKKDGSVPWQQGVEFFTTLRRLSKKVWMLQYDNGVHQLVEEADMKDYSTRMSQFFDHYLKGLVAPSWITEQIPANLKGTSSGL